MSVFDVLQERGFIKQMSHETEIKELLDNDYLYKKSKHYVDEKYNEFLETVAKFDNYIGKYNLTLIYKSNGNVEVIGKIGNNIAAQIITDILNLNLPANYNDILIQMRGYDKYAGAFFDQFKDAIGIVLFASDPDAVNSTINDEK